jgi:hypothetical protein
MAAYAMTDRHPGVWAPAQPIEHHRADACSVGPAYWGRRLQSERPVWPMSVVVLGLASWRLRRVIT